MKKILLLVLCFSMLMFVGCLQRTKTSNARDDLKAPSQTQLQTTEKNENTGIEPYSEEQNNSETTTVNDDQSISSNSQLTPKTGTKVVEIKEKMYIQQCDDIYMNPDDYEGKIIKLEGMYQEVVNTDTGKKYHIIYRKTPGCCGADGQTGFQFTYNATMPKPNDWIKVAGTIEVVEDSDGYEDIVLHLTELEVSDKRGAEFVKY